MHDLFRDTAKHHLAEAFLPVRTDDDQLGAAFLGGMQDGAGNIARCYRTLDEARVAGQAGGFHAVFCVVEDVLSGADEVGVQTGRWLVAGVVENVAVVDDMDDLDGAAEGFGKPNGFIQCLVGGRAAIDGDKDFCVHTGQIMPRMRPSSAT